MRSWNLSSAVAAAGWSAAKAAFTEDEHDDVGPVDRSRFAKVRQLRALVIAVLDLSA